MSLLRIKSAVPIGGFRLRLTLTDDSVVERDVERLLTGPVFETLRRDPVAFRAVFVEGGSLGWPNGADLCPDTVIWNGPPKEGVPPPARLELAL